MILVISQGEGSFTINYQPERLGKTEEELLEIGVLFESIPIPEVIAGKDAILKFDGVNLYYEYVDIPLTLEQQLAEVRLTTEGIDTRTIGMQEIDAFTLDKSMVLETRAEGMQEVDDFTLLLVNQMQTKIDELEAKILILEGQ